MPYSVEEGGGGGGGGFCPPQPEGLAVTAIMSVFLPQLLLLVRTFLWIDHYKLVIVTDMTDMAKVGRITKAEKQWHVTHTMQ